MHQPTRPQDFTQMFQWAALALTQTVEVGSDGRLYPVSRVCPVCHVVFREDDDETVGVTQLTHEVMGIHDDERVRAGSPR